jgi:hypothetical protein
VHTSIIHRAPLVAVLALSAATPAFLGCAKVHRPSPRVASPESGPPPSLAALWSDPADLAQRDLFHGPGGRALAPAPGGSFTFVAKDTTGFSPGWDVRDASGRVWDVKQGPEAQSEVVASRLLWAAGYHQPPTYYVPEWTLVGGPEPGRQGPGRFRPQVDGWRKKGTWEWARNPFVGTPPYRGLVVLMHMLSNWDLLDRNTARYDVDPATAGAPTLYLVQDVGAALGKARSLPGQASRNDVDDFETQGFVKGLDRDGYVVFDDTRWQHHNLYERVSPADVRWAAQRLLRLTPQQWQDAFRAGGYEPSVADRFIGKIKEKVRLGMALGDAAVPPAGEGS